MPRGYRSATPKEKAKLENARERMVRGMEAEKGLMARVSTTTAKGARDEQKMAKQMYESVPEEAREGEAYDVAGYKSGGMVKVRGQGAARKSKGCKVC
jgi:metal-dependent amidase/aminoacylase/carboxypeptidase family protein